jgi:hypothetical protein
MPNVKLQIITLAPVALFVLCSCGGSGIGSQSSAALNLSGFWSFTTSAGVVGQLALTQQGAQITGTLAAPNYHGPVPGVGNPSIAGTLTGSSLQGTITGTYGSPQSPLACGEGILNAIAITIDLTGTMASNGNLMTGQFVAQPTTCFSGNSGNWSASRM